MLAVAVSDLVSDCVLIRQVLVVEEMLPALGLIEIPDLRLNDVGDHESSAGVVTDETTTGQIAFNLQSKQIPSQLLHELRVVRREELHHKTKDGVFRPSDLFQRRLQQIQPHRHLALILVLQAEIVSFNQVEMNTNQVKQHFARGSLRYLEDFLCVIEHLNPD